MTEQVYIETFGCQMNEHDSDRISKILNENGYQNTQEILDANLILFNTCSVREGPENKLHSYIGRVRHLKENNPELLIAVGGCVAQQEKENILKKEQAVDIVFGPDNIAELPSLIKKAKSGFRQLAVKWQKEPFQEIASGLVKAGTAIVAITKGCDNFCSFCIVPYTRGREYSRPQSDIVNEVKDLVSNGAKEIMLVGQNVNSYQNQQANFYTLLDELSLLPNLKRLRFISPHPKDWNSELSKLMADRPSICNHLHLPFQSGSTKILKLMRRDHDITSYLNKIAELKKLIPSISLSTDIIVGFPGETDEDFQATLQVLKKVKFNQIYSFKYSPRPGTRASRMEDSVSPELKSARLAILNELHKAISKENLESLVGSKQEVLVNRQNEFQSTGKCEANITVNIDSTELKMGEVYPVSISKALQNSLIGKLIN